jgi:GMP synthase (glutamine-hydrolysing)
MQFQNEKVIIVDFGSQVTKLIARRIRELGVYSEIITPEALNKIENYQYIKGLILSGGPSSVTDKKFQSISKEVFKKKIPILGICYGLQLIAKLFGGKINSAKKKI